MRSHLRIILLAGVLLALFSLLVLLWGTPRLLEIAPADGERDVPAGTQVRLTFSRPMQDKKVQERLSFEPSVAGSYSWDGPTLVFTPDRPWPAGASIQVRLLPGASASGFPPLALREGRQWAFEVRQPQIAYLYPAAGPANLFSFNTITGESMALTEIEAGVLDYAVSRDGKSLYYSARSVTDGSAIFRLDLAEAQESASVRDVESGAPAAQNPQLVLECPLAACGVLALEPAGRYLAYERSAFPGGGGPQKPQVWVLPLGVEGANTPFLAGQPDHQTLLPSWSNTGLLSFYDTDEAAYLFVEPQGQEKARFTNQTGQQGSWRPDGDAFLAAEIFYLNANVSPELSNLESLADSHLILFDLGTQQSEDLTPGEGLEDAAPAYSPDGSLLAFARKYLDIRRWTPGRQLWIAQASSRDARQLSDSPEFNHFDFAWNSTGDRLAYVRFDQSALNEPPEIWVFDLLANQSSRLVLGGYKPLWIP
jgi:Tol biopolymer transport system component